MRPRDTDRARGVMIAVMTATIALGLAACGSSAASGDPTLPAGSSVATTEATTVATAAVTTVPGTTAVPVATVPGTEPAATAPPSSAANPAVVVVSGADIADLEKQLDEIDQLLVGVDADLNQD